MKTREEQLIHLYKRLYNEVDEDFAGEVILNIIEKDLKIYYSSFYEYKKRYNTQNQINEDYIDDVSLDNVVYIYNMDIILTRNAIIDALEKSIISKFPKREVLSDYDKYFIENQKRNLAMFYDYYENNLTYDQLAKKYNLTRERTRQVCLRKLNHIRRLLKYDASLKDLF